MTTGIEGVVLRPLRRHTDARGWLMELVREDELPDGYVPAMAYISVTLPGVVRGPHEHRRQSDGFCFVAGHFRLTLWENRPGRPRRCEVHDVGAGNPAFVLVPAGVVHAYENAGAEEAYVLNFPDRLYAGRGRCEPVDEIRHEDIDSPFKIGSPE
jgi:dTDP-4-dehydrorhamnose 3,5-epimerase